MESVCRVPIDSTEDVFEVAERLDAHSPAGLDDAQQYAGGVAAFFAARAQRQVGSSDAYVLAKIVSGGQTGADRGGLDAAIAKGVPHGGLTSV